MSLYSHPNFGDVQKFVFMKGIITAVYSEDDTADVTIPGGNDGTATAIFYHCSDDAEERDNGAIEGGSAAFSAGTEDDPEDGDKVIVMYDVEAGEAVRIIGFVDGIKDCGFQFRIIRDLDNHIVTDAMTYDGYWYSDDFSYSIPYIKLISNIGQQNIFYGDEEWWADHNMEEDWGSWEDYHTDYDTEGNPVGELVLSYNENSQIWTCPIPKSIRDFDGYLVQIQIQQSINTQFITPAMVEDQALSYDYVWKIGENNSGDPYVSQEYPEEDDEHEGYMNLVQPGSYDFHVPYFQITNISQNPSLVYERLDPDVSYAYAVIPIPSNSGMYPNLTYYWAPSEFTRSISWESDLPCYGVESTDIKQVRATGYAGCIACDWLSVNDPCYPDGRWAGATVLASIEIVGSVLSYPGSHYERFSVGSSGTLSMTTTLSYGSLTSNCQKYNEDTGEYEQVDYTVGLHHFYSENRLNSFGLIGVGIDYDSVE